MKVPVGFIPQRIKLGTVSTEDPWKGGQGKFRSGKSWPGRRVKPPVIKSNRVKLIRTFTSGTGFGETRFRCSLTVVKLGERVD